MSDTPWMTSTRRNLYAALLLERYGQVRRTPRKPIPAPGLDKCRGCGQFADPDQPCPVCRSRRSLAAATRERLGVAR